MNIITIDPGASGGIAICTNGVVEAHKMPQTTADLRDFLRKYTGFVWVEKVGGYMPGNSGPASVKFARHCGRIDGVLTTLFMPWDEIAPQKWMKALGALPKDKADRKRAIKAKMQQVYPHIKVTLDTADALGMMYWAQNRGAA